VGGRGLQLGGKHGELQQGGKHGDLLTRMKPCGEWGCCSGKVTGVLSGVEVIGTCQRDGNYVGARGSQQGGKHGVLQQGGKHGDLSARCKPCGR
jgi:hypothetical protein